MYAIPNLLMIDRAAGRVLYEAPTGLDAHPDRKNDKIAIQGDSLGIEIDDRLEFPNCQGPRLLHRVLFARYRLRGRF